ncbi:hypothetical protein, partial [Streptomyces sp. 2A115]|uniref:hypothetical protein n=1 Tax=Streptomyces sp. 2A115 TaxID=3457439 RepID=UPI003FD13F7D
MKLMDWLRGRGGRGQGGNPDGRVGDDGRDSRQRHDGDAHTGVAAAGEPAAAGAVTGGATPSTGWPGLPPIQRSVADGRAAGVADAGFSGRLPTWQNPSFLGTPSGIGVLDASPGSLLSGALTNSARPGTGLERPVDTPAWTTAAREPTVQR